MARLARAVLCFLPLVSGLQLGDGQANFLAKTERVASSKPPKTAIILAGLMRNWDTWSGEWIRCFMERMVKPNDADIFIHTTNWRGETRILAFSPDPKEYVPANSTQIFGDHLKDYKVEDQPHEQGMADMQYWHLEKVWEMMRSYERRNNIRYDVVVKTRTEIAPDRNSSAILDLSRWRQDKGKIHMMSDMVWWGERDDMQKTTGFYTAIPLYYKQKYPDPLGRPIHVKELLASMEVDPLYSTGDMDANWHTLNKLATLPYPDMGKEGPLANLKAAVEAGIDLCIPGKNCQARHGEKGSGGDYTYGEVRCEKDILDYVLQQGLSICDIGASMHTIFIKGEIEERPHARDC